MSDQFSQNGGRPDFAPPELRGPMVPTPYILPGPSQAPVEEPVRPRLSMKTGAAVVAGLVAILLVSGAVTVWATSPRPQSAMPAAWTAEPSTATTVAKHPTAPVATGNRATSPTSSATPRTSSSASTKATTSTKPASTARITSGSNLPTCARTVSGSAFSLTIPEGWECMGDPSSDPDVLVLIFNPALDIIQVTVISSKDAATGCGADLATQVTTLVPQPDTAWGGKASKTAKIAVGSLVAQARCVESKGVVYMMVGAATDGTYESVVTAMSAVGSAWLWK